MNHDDPAELNRLIADIEDQQGGLLFDSFSNDDGIALGEVLVQLGRERALPITVDVSRGEQQLFRAALTGSTVDQQSWIARKRATVIRFGEPSFLVGLRSRAAGGRFEDKPGIDHLAYAAHGGSFPITVKGVGIVGTVTVSGLPQEDDHALVVEAIGRFLTPSPAPRRARAPRAAG